MSNVSLLNRIEDALEKYQRGEINRKALISAVEDNGRALEMMPYTLFKEIDQIEYRLTVAQFADEDDFVPEEQEVISQLRQWLAKVPREGAGGSS